MNEFIASAIAAGRKVFGPDLDMMVARSPGWGHEDCCVIVRGTNHAAAARAFREVAKDAVVEQVQAWNHAGEPYTYSTVTFAALEGAAS